jgi:biopolymer transport protein ExbD
MQFVRKPRRRPFINIIPLIDVLVVLLIFYIATTVFKKNQPKITIKVPDSTQAKSTQETLPSIIYVTADGKLFLNDAAIEPEQLADALKAKVQASPTFKVAMKADTKAPFGIIAKVMDAAHAANISDLQTFMDVAKPAAGASSP